MPHAIQYEIARSVAPGFTLGTFHTFMPAARDKDRSRKASRKRVISLGGRAVTTYYHGATTWTVQTTPQSATNAAIMQMFLDSVEDGQVFWFDPIYAPGHSPNALRAVVLDGDSYSEDRKVRRGAGGGSDMFVFEFKMREVTG